MVIVLAELTKGHMEPVFALIESSDFNPVRFCILSIKNTINKACAISDLCFVTVLTLHCVISLYKRPAFSSLYSVQTIKKE